MDLDLAFLSRQIETLNEHHPEEVLRDLSPSAARELRKNLLRLSIALESPGDIVESFIYSPLDLVAIRIAVDLGLFKILANSRAPKSIQQLAEETRADATLLGRILRCLASIDAVEDAGPEIYVATKISKAFTTMKGISAAGVFTDCGMPSWSALPATLATSHYQNPTDNLHAAFQYGLRTDKLRFQWVAEHPKVFNSFNNWMTAQREGRAYWLDFYPFEQKLSAKARDDEHEILFVDVGGALGSEIRELRRRYPALKGRMILQEVQQTVDLASANPGVEAMVHDFFTPQPLIDAQIYYLRNVLHDWPDALARLILRQISSAMKTNVSRLLINELVVPLQGGGILPPHADLNMMSIHAGMERTEDQWKELLTSVGLRIDKIWTGEGETESTIEAVVASRNGPEAGN